MKIAEKCDGLVPDARPGSNTDRVFADPVSIISNSAITNRMVTSAMPRTRVTLVEVLTPRYASRVTVATSKTIISHIGGVTLKYVSRKSRLIRPQLRALAQMNKKYIGLYIHPCKYPISLPSATLVYE